MLKLCAKDYLCGRWFWLAASAMYALYVIQPLGMSAILMALGGMLLLANLKLPLFFEDKDKTEALYASLPLRRADIVRGRYLLAGLLLAGSGLVIFGPVAAVKTLVHSPAYQNSLSPLLSVEGIAGYLLGGGSLYAAFLPLYHKLGLGRSSLVFYPGLLILLGAAGGLERLGSGTLEIIPPVITAEFLKDPGQGVIAAIGSFRSALGTPIFGLVTIALFAAMAVISLRLSVRFYEGREF
jgi:hypothetical protein